jgi:hypothetical protein
MSDMPTQVAESSPAPAVAAFPEHPVTEIPQGEARTQFLATGKLPEATKQDQPKPADPAPARAPQEPSQAQPSASPTEAKKTPQESFAELRAAKERAERRVKELEAAQAKPDAKPAESSPAPAESKPAELNKPVKPNLEQFATYQEYETATDKYYEDLADYRAELKSQQLRQELKQQREAEEREQKQKAIDERVHARFAESQKKHADFKAKVFTDSGELMLADVLKANMGLDTFLAESEHGTELLYLLSSNPAEATRIASLDQLNTLRELVKLELNLSNAADMTPAPKKTTSAPPPPTVLSGRNSEPEDEAMAAAASGDFRRFKAIEDAKALGRRR